MHLESLNYFNEENIRKEFEFLSFLSENYNNDLYLENLKY